jgi:hypothetical protein
MVGLPLKPQQLNRIIAVSGEVYKRDNKGTRVEMVL